MSHEFDFFTIFVKGLGNFEILVSVIGIISATAFAGVWVTKLGSIILPHPNESRVSDFLPFDRLMSDGATIKCNDGTFARVFKVDGVDLSFSTAAKDLLMGEARKSFIDNMSDLQITCRVITIRDRVELAEVKDDFQNELLERISEIWRNTLDRIYGNDHYVILSVPNRRDALKDLNYASQTLTAILNDYNVETMVDKGNSDAKKSPLYIFARLCSPISKPVPKIGGAVGDHLNGLISADHIHFTGEEGVIRFFSGEKQMLSISMGLRNTGDYMDENMVVSLMSLDGELVILHNISPKPKHIARGLLMQQRKMAEVTSFSGDVLDQYTYALSLIDNSDSSYQALTEYSMTIMLKATTMEELLFIEGEVQKICRSFGFTPVREGWVAQATFFNQFPSYDVYPRTYLYLSRVVASAISFNKPSEGFAKSDWGQGAITIFRTATGSPYQFQFHVSGEEGAVAHCCIIGPTGQGKTTLLSFLAGQAMRHGDLKVFFFDRHRGAEIFTRAVKGAYVGFEGDDKNVSLNPFDCADNSNNRAFLRRWMKSIAVVDDALSEKEISRAVTTAFEYLKPEERVMSSLYKSCFSPTGNMRRELYRWVNPDQYGKIFNATNDSLDLKSQRFMAFDFTHIFEDETLAPAVISYIMHRIQSETGETGVPSLIMIDETAPMLKHPMFRDYFIIGLQEGRKKRQAYLCAFQQPNIIDKLGVGEVIRGQCQTVIFFRNPQSTMDDYINWNLTDKEMNFIFGRSYREFPYAILLSRQATGESVILDVNIGGLGPYLKLYNSGRKNVLLVADLIKEHGEENFVTKYLNL